MNSTAREGLACGPAKGFSIDGQAEKLRVATFGLKRQVLGPAGGSAYMRAARVQGGGPGRVTVCEAPATTDELHAA